MKHLCNMRTAFLHHPRYKALAFLIAILGGYVFIVLLDYVNNHEHTGTFCIIKNITGIPCPGCGMGRASLAILKGNFTEAFQYNILSIPFTLFIIASVCWLVYDVIKEKDTFFRTINKKINTNYLIILAVIILSSWIINIIWGI